MALSEPDLHKEEESELGSSNGDGTSPLEHPESPGAKDDTSPIGGSGQLDREPPAFMNAGKDQPQTGSSDETQQIPPHSEQLPPLPNPRAQSGAEGSSEEVCEAALPLLTRNTWLELL